MKSWIKYRGNFPSGNPISAFVMIIFFVLVSGSSLNAQPDSVRRWRSSEPVLYQPPTETTTHEIFETGNWHRAYIETDRVRFQNALSDTTIAKVDLENYLATHQPGDSAKLAIHLTNTNIESDGETMRLIASSWKCFTFVLVTPLREEE